MERIQVKTNERISVERRKISTILLAITMILSATFVACDKTNGDDDENGGGNTQIDSPIVGHYWHSMLETGMPMYDIYHEYVFNSNGTFIFIERNNQTTDAAVWKGNYDVNGDKISIKNRVKSSIDWGKYWTPQVNTYGKEIAAIIEASKDAVFSASPDLPASETLTFLLSNDGQEHTSYEGKQVLTITDTKSIVRKYRIVKK